MEIRYLDKRVVKEVPGIFFNWSESYTERVLQYRTKKDGEWITVPVVQEETKVQ